MFTEISKPASKVPERRGRGRPRGTTEQGVETRRQLFETAIGLIGSRGYQATTLREIAKKAEVSVGLLYRYFPSKRAVVLALYDELSTEYAARALPMKPGPWRARFLFALSTSLGVLADQRTTLAALTPVLVGDANDGLFAPTTASSRQRVQRVFDEAVRGAVDAPGPGDAAALGRLLYLVHLVVILFWLLDRSAEQSATSELLGMLERTLPIVSVALKLASSRALLRSADDLLRRGLFGDEGATA